MPDGGPISPAALALLGSWRLVSCQSVDGLGAISLPYGPEPVGYLLYTPQGYMAASLMAREIPTTAGDDVFGGPGREGGPGGASAHRFIAYTGRFEADERHVRHFLETCSFPNWVGTTQERGYVLDEAGERLTLTTPPITRGGVRGVGTVIWRRV